MATALESGSTNPTGTFTPAQSPLSSFDEFGYAVLEDVMSDEELDQLRAEIVAICRAQRGDFEGLLPVDETTPDDEVITPYIAIHTGHKISPIMYATLAHPAFVGALTQVIGPNVKAMQQQLFIKAAGKPGLAWHQDEMFIPTRDRSLTALWIALDDATIENGCLWVIPGSHTRGVIYPDRVPTDRRFACASEAYDFPYTDDDSIPLEVKAGSAIMFNGYLLHRSLPHTGRKGFRRALVNHYMSAESLLPWQQLPAGTNIARYDFRDIVMVAGEDPYAYKGFEERSVPGVRMAGEDGCHK